jgi:hypothetical protein
MSILNNAAATEPRYQAIRGALHTARPLTDLDKCVKPIAPSAHSARQRS